MEREVPIRYKFKLNQHVITPLSAAPYVVIELHPEEHRITVMSTHKKRLLRIAEHKIKPFVEKHSLSVEGKKAKNKNKKKRKKK